MANRSNEMGLPRRRVASAMTTRRRAGNDSDTRQARAVSRERPLTPSAFNTAPGACMYRGCMAPRSMKRRLYSNVPFWSAGDRNDPFRRAEIAPTQSLRINTEKSANGNG